MKHLKQFIRDHKKAIEAATATGIHVAGDSLRDAIGDIFETANSANWTRTQFLAFKAIIDDAIDTVDAAAKEKPKP